YTRHWILRDRHVSCCPGTNLATGVDGVFQSPRVAVDSTYDLNPFHFGQRRAMYDPRRSWERTYELPTLLSRTAEWGAIHSPQEVQSLLFQRCTVPGKRDHSRYGSARS